MVLHNLSHVEIHEEIDYLNLIMYRSLFIYLKYFLILRYKIEIKLILLVLNLIFYTLMLKRVQLINLERG